MTVLWHRRPPALIELCDIYIPTSTATHISWNNLLFSVSPHYARCDTFHYHARIPRLFILPSRPFHLAQSGIVHGAPLFLNLSFFPPQCIHTARGG